MSVLGTRATFVAVLVVGLLSGCVVAEPPPVVSAPPPAPPAQVEVASPTPGPGYVWVPGHWAPRGPGFVWIEGRWRAR